MNGLPRRELLRAPPVLSVVIPLLNEEAVLEQTYRVLKTHLDALGETYEIVFVDDGSTDRSRAILAAKRRATRPCAWSACRATSATRWRRRPACSTPAARRPSSWTPTCRTRRS